MTARDLIILPPGHEGAGFMLTRTEHGIALHTGGFGNAHPSAVYELSDANVAQIIAFLTANPSEPAKSEPLPAWRYEAGVWMRGGMWSHWAVAGDAMWRIYESSKMSAGLTSAGTTPSVWHAMHAADAALLAAGHTLTDPAPEPPDLSGVTFGAWRTATSGSFRDTETDGTAWLTDGRFGYDGVDFPHITTREAADAFLRACGATLEGES